MTGAVQALEPLTRKTALALVGGLSNPSKMPGLAYGLPARECKVGATLVGIAGSVCNGCYAFRGNYRFSNVQDAQYRRLATLTNPRWVEAFVLLLADCRHFRWHDSGDIQSPSHLANIVLIAQSLPQVRFWMPTREKVFVYSHLKTHGSFPKNLVVRVSGTMVDGPPPAGFANTSTVTTGKATCPAPTQGNECGACRRCWNPKVKNVSYKKH